MYPICKWDRKFNNINYTYISCVDSYILMQYLRWLKQRFCMFLHITQNTVSNSIYFRTSYFYELGGLYYIQVQICYIDFLYNHKSLNHFLMGCHIYPAWGVWAEIRPCQCTWTWKWIESIFCTMSWCIFILSKCCFSYA